MKAPAEINELVNESFVLLSAGKTTDDVVRILREKGCSKIDCIEAAAHGTEHRPRRGEKDRPFESSLARVPSLKRAMNACNLTSHEHCDLIEIGNSAVKTRNRRPKVSYSLKVIACRSLP